MQKVDRPVGKSRGEYVKTIYKEENCMRKGMYGKLTMLAVAGVMALSGCGNSGGDTGTAAEPKGETTALAGTETEKALEEASQGEKEPSIGRTDIISANTSDIRSMDPQVGVDSPSATLNRHIYNGLVKIDENREVVGDLAESFEMVDDKTYKFKLREGVKFHNGEELKASDVKFSLERAKTMPKAMSNASAIDHVSVEGDYDLTIHLSRPYPSLLYVLNDTSMKILSEKAVTEAGETYGEEPIGTGPFMFKEWVPNDHWTLVRFDDYFDGPATATSITNRIIPEGSARTIALETGEIDVILTVDPVDAANVEANDELVLESWPSASVEFMAFNTTKKGLDDVRVRQAITYAMNRQEFVDTIVEGRGEVASSFIAKTLPGWNEEVQPYPQDLEKAKELLAEAGYGDGLDLKMYVSGDVRKVVQAQLAQIGVNVDINVYEWGAFQDAINAGEHELLILGWTNTTCDPEYSVTPLFHSKNCGMNGNRAYLRDEKVDEMIDAASMETDREKRLQTYRDLQVRLNELCPWVPLYYKSNMVGRRADLKGFQFNKNTALHYLGDCYFEK